MRISYDPKIDAIYIHFRKGKYDRTKKVTADILVDVNKKGKVLGVEILDASKNISAFKPQSVTFDWMNLAKPVKGKIPSRAISV